jgi:hypothetical protein
MIQTLQRFGIISMFESTFLHLVPLVDHEYLAADASVFPTFYIVASQRLNPVP